MGQFNSRTLLTIEDVCDAIGCEKQTAYNEISKGVFPLPMRKQGKRWMADIRDVAEYLDAQRNAARDAYKALQDKMNARG